MFRVIEKVGGRVFRSLVKFFILGVFVFRFVKGGFISRFVDIIEL